MNESTKLFLAAAAALALGAALASIVSNARIRSMERTIEAAKQRAGEADEAAAASEIKAAEYEKKIEYLDSEISGMSRLARRQDEELEKLDIGLGMARRDAERKKRVRAIGTTADELCRKLEELGHPCRQPGGEDGRIDLP